jgi:hypothetical protein
VWSGQVILEREIQTMIEGTHRTDRHLASKEECDALIALLLERGIDISRDDYRLIIGFLQAAHKRLPSRQAIDNDRSRKLKRFGKYQPRAEASES